jgi:DNA-binding NtrC family response regulator
MAKHAVLVVDDDGLVRGVLRRILTTKGYQVFEAATLGLAVTAIEKFPVDLVFLDIYLPDGSGLDAMEKFFAVRPGLKVALISTDTSQFEMPQAKGAQVIDCIGKPLSPERIERVLHAVFGEAA